MSRYPSPASARASDTPFKPTLLAVALLLGGGLMTGCATERAISEQAQPLQERLDRLEGTVTTQGDHHARALEQRHAALATHMEALERRVGQIESQISPLRDGILALERRITPLETEAGQRDRRITELGARVAETEARQRDDATRLAERIARGETQLHTQATRMDEQARQGTDTARRIDALSDSLRANGDALAELTALQRRGETRLAEIAAASAEGARRTDALAARQQADAASHDALAQRMAAAEHRLSALTEQVQEALALASKEIFLAMGREAFTVTLTEDKVLYPLNDPNLDRRDLARLDELVRRLAELDQEYHLDIQGHTDNTSTDDNNYNLGKARAEVVKRYLAGQKGISVNRMSTVSYGANKPLDPAGRHNRRIHIRVLVLK